MGWLVFRFQIRTVWSKLPETTAGVLSRWVTATARTARRWCGRAVVGRLVRRGNIPDADSAVGAAGDDHVATLQLTDGKRPVSGSLAAWSEVSSHTRTDPSAAPEITTGRPVELSDRPAPARPTPQGSG